MTSLWLTMKTQKKLGLFFMMQKLHSGVWNWTFMANKKEEWIGVSGEISILPKTRLFVIFKNMLSNPFPELSLIVPENQKSFRVPIPPLLGNVLLERERNTQDIFSKIIIRILMNLCIKEAMMHRLTKIFI